MLRAALVGAVVMTAAWAASTGSAWAVTCDDYPNQPAAQRAADTRDADGDGIYCEALPCPCSTGVGAPPPWRPSPPSRPTPRPQPRPQPKPVKPPAEHVEAQIIDVLDGDTI